MQPVPQLLHMGATRILIVEDHRDSREALTALFEAFGYEVVIATNGREAIRVAAEAHPDLILMDIMMPELDGFDAARGIRAVPGLEQVPIIALTAMEGVRQLALEAGMSDYVRKPVEIHGLLAKIDDFLKPSAA